MGVFNVSFLRPGAAKGGSGYGVLVDQLSILENGLASDGNLSPGDYDLLIKRARDLATHPGLTADQRSNVNVKISAYQKAKDTGAIDSSGDIARLNREVQDDNRTNTMINAGDPAAFLDARAASLRLKANQLEQAVEQRSISGDDFTAHQNEYASTLQDLNDTLDALDAVNAYKAAPTAKPLGNFVAYMDTNSRGEIIGLEIGKPNSKQGYSETNALYGGLQVYGKPNRKEGGENVFRLGTTDYKGSDMQFQDPSNPLAFRNAPLTSTGGAGKFGVINTYQDIAPNTIQPQRVIRPGDYARGKDGTIYFSNPAGGYRKYKNVLPDQLGINPQNLLDIPSSLEQNVNAQSTETVDGNESAFAPMSLPMGAYDRQRAGSPPPAAPAAPAQSTQAPPAASSRTPSPVSRAPGSATGLAQETIQKAKGFVSRLLG